MYLNTDTSMIGSSSECSIFMQEIATGPLTRPDPAMRTIMMDAASSRPFLAPIRPTMTGAMNIIPASTNICAELR